MNSVLCFHLCHQLKHQLKALSGYSAMQLQTALEKWEI